MNKNRTCPPEFIGENRDPRRYPAPNTPPKPKFIDALEITENPEQYSTPVKKDPKTGLLYSNAEFLRAESDSYHISEHKRLDDRIDEEAKDRYNQIMAVDEVNQYRLNEEKAARESQDVILGDRIDRHEVKVDELHVEADRVHNSKLDKNFSNAEISTLPVSSSDYVVIVSNGKTYRVTLEQLKVLLTSSIDYFKGIHATLKALQAAHPTGKPGDYAFVEEDANNTDKFVMYVWDEAQEEGQWEETTSSQFATQADYTALVQSLLDGTFNLGSVKANSSPEESPLLKSLHVNQKDYSLPSVEIELSDEHVEGAKDMYSITFNGNTWNIPKNIVQIEFSDKNVKDVPTLGSITIGGATWNLVSADYINNEIAKIKAEILGEDISETFDTLKEIQDWIENEGVEATELAQAVAGKQNKLTAGEGISISEDGVISVTFTAPTIEEWNGSYEEISSGYTLTLNSFDEVYYALGDNDNFTQITSETLVLNNVTTIKFKTQYYGGSDGAAFYIKKNGSVILSIFNDIGTLTIEEDTTLTAEWGPFSGGGAN